MAEVQLEELGPEQMLVQVRAEIDRLKEHEAALLGAIDLKHAEEEARRPKPDFIADIKAAARRSFQEKLQKVAEGESPLSPLDQIFLARGRRR